MPPRCVRRSEIEDKNLVVRGVKPQSEEWRPTEIALLDQAAVFPEPHELVRIGSEVERAHVDLTGGRIGGDALGEAHAIRQHGKLHDTGQFRHSAFIGPADTCAHYHCARDETRDQ